MLIILLKELAIEILDNIPYNIFIYIIIGECYMKNHYVYKITHIETGCFYIGMRSCKADIAVDPYLGSGIIIKKFINKYGKEAFKKEILYIGNSRTDISNKEKELVTIDLLSNPLCLNLRTGGEFKESFTFHPDVCMKISKSLKQFYSNEENIKALSERTKDYYEKNPEAKKRISDMRKYYTNDPEHIKKVKEIRKFLHENTDLNEKIKIGLNKPEVKLKRSQIMKEICNEQSAKQRLSQATKDTIYINKDGVTKRIKPDELQDYLFLNWNLGIGYDISIETKSKIGEKSKNLVWVYNDKLKKCKRFKNNVVDEFLENNLDWKKGFRKW